MKPKFIIQLSFTALFFFLSCVNKQKETDNTNDSTVVLSNDESKVEADIISLKSLGLAYLEENNLEEAKKQFLKLIELAPNDATGYANLGVVYLRQRDIDRAEESLLKAVELSPDDPDIRLNLAKVYELKNDRETSLKELKKNEELAPDHVKTLYSIAEKYQGERDARSMAQWEAYMRKIVNNAPGNIVARLYLVEALVRSDQGDEALKNLEEVEQIFPEFSEESRKYFDEAMEMLQNKKTKEALTPILIFHNFLKLTIEYQRGIGELKGTQSNSIGVPIISFTQSSYLDLQEGESILNIMKFTEATDGAGLDIFDAKKMEENAIYISNIAVGDMDRDGDDDVYFSGYGVDKNITFQHLLKNEFGRFEDITAISGIHHSGNDHSAKFADFDNDGFLDLFVSNSSSDILYRNVDEGVFENVTAKSGLKGNSYRSLPIDIDHEGDLDVVVARNGKNSTIRNNGDGSMSINVIGSELAKDSYNSQDLAFGDFDRDGDLDIVVANLDGPIQVFSNLRQGKFIDITKESGIQGEGFSVVEVADLDNDGDLDILSASQSKGVLLLQNDGNGKFGTSKLTTIINKMAKGIAVYDVALFDFDNDGFTDILIAGEANKPDEKGVLLIHNEGDNYLDVTHLIPQDISNGRRIAFADYNNDGDMDIFLVDIKGRLKLLRNDGGNANHHLTIKLVGLKTGSGKNNYYGIGSTVEVRAGDLYQMKLITGPEQHFGLGQRDKADVVRILWTNGTPQNIFSPGSDQDLIETQEVKGSCPFLYTWNGKEYVFVKDMMWRSALGMPLGIMGGKTAFAFPNASMEYLKIPGELLKERDNRYTIQVTSELWETIYADEIKLIAVDHPSDVDIYVDEKFAAPPYPELKILKVKNHRLPVSAVDGDGYNLSGLIKNKDNRYIFNFLRDKFQGITQMKDLILDLGDIENTQNLYLFLNGWIFPTDASINVALSQSEAIKIKHPSLEVINENGEWQEVIPDIGFPSGKNKTVIVDLSGEFLSVERKVRIRTNMQIYWDHVFFAQDEDLKINMTKLTPELVDLHYRGFSTKFRKGGRYGPHWFDYDDVTTGQKWRDLTGNYTRYGDVTELLQEADNMYIISNAGDEMTISFDAAKLPQLKKGWTRDFLIYSVGWVKDGDLNTATGQTVAPLPFHGMSQYPYGNNENYPMSDKILEYQKKYNVRGVGTDSFKNFVIGGPYK